MGATILMLDLSFKRSQNFCSHNLLVLWLALVIFLITDDVIGVLALGSTDGVMSRLQTAQCEMQVSVGRIPGTAMPSDWAASGAKLSFNLEVEFCREACANPFEMAKERLLSASAEATKQSRSRTSTSSDIKLVEPLNDPTFVSTSGTQHILVKDGAYACTLQNLQSQQYALRFCLDFPEGALRNDVELPAERVYFLSTCWIVDNEAGLERARSRYRELQTRLKDIQTEISSLQSASSGFLGQVLGLRQMTLLVEKKNALLTQLNDLEQSYPLQEPDMQSAKKLLEGPNGLTFAKDGVIAVKRFAGAMDTREQYHWIGTFSITEFFEELDEQ